MRRHLFKTGPRCGPPTPSRRRSQHGRRRPRSCSIAQSSPTSVPSPTRTSSSSLSIGSLDRRSASCSGATCRARVRRPSRSGATQPGLPHPTSTGEPSQGYSISFTVGHALFIVSAYEKEDVILLDRPITLSGQPVEDVLRRLWPLARGRSLGPRRAHFDTSGLGLLRREQASRAERLVVRTVSAVSQDSFWDDSGTRRPTPSAPDRVVAPRLQPGR